MTSSHYLIEEGIGIFIWGRGERPKRYVWGKLLVKSMACEQNIFPNLNLFQKIVENQRLTNRMALGLVFKNPNNFSHLWLGRQQCAVPYLLLALVMHKCWLLELPCAQKPSRNLTNQRLKPINLPIGKKEPDMPTINLETDVHNVFTTLEVVEPPYFPVFTGEETLMAYAECWSEEKQLWYWTEIQHQVDSRAYHRVLVDGKEWWAAWTVIKALGLPDGRYTQQELRTALSGLIC